MSLLQEVLLDRGTWCGTSTSRDFERVAARVEHEGLSFLTITLPKFGSDFQQGLDQGFVDRRLFTGFQWKGGLPVFLRGFLGLVFDKQSGVLLQEPSIDAIQAIRQITLMFGKIELPCSDARNSAAIEKYLECEKDLHTAYSALRTDDLAQFYRLSGLLWNGVLQRVDEDVYYGRIVPKHGPGATADRLRGNAKYNQRQWTQRLEEYFPYGEFALPNWRFYQDLDQVEFLEPGQEIPVKVTLVPKTLRTPRIIAVEPTCMQYAQQAICESLVGHIEGRDNPLYGLIGFADQDPNRDLARIGSREGTLATLDLSEASDRVSYKLVQGLLSRHPHARGAVDACRSRTAWIPEKDITIPLKKFASMGSALCFPIEAMVFATVVMGGIENALGRQLTGKDVKSLIGRVRIYGDDIIVPVEYVPHVICNLELFGLRVNADKSFWTGKFRESCGKEYYDGHDVSIVKVRRLLPTRREDVSELVSADSLRNQLYEFGYWGVVRHLDRLISRLITYPTVHATSSLLGRHTVLDYQVQRMCPTLHVPLVKGHVVSSKAPPSVLDGAGALLKWFLKRGSDPFADVDHLMRSGRARTVSTKTRWAKPY